MGTDLDADGLEPPQFFQFAERDVAGRRAAARTPAYRYFNLEIERPSIPNVEAWYRRLQDRSAYRRHVMMPFQELFGRLDD